MKTVKPLAIAIMLLLTVGAGAQITLTAETSIPHVGDVFTYRNTNVQNLNVTHSGANREWDMSVVEEGVPGEVRFINVAESLQPSTSANFVGTAEQNGIVGESYYTANSTAIVYNKLYSQGVTLASYTDVREALMFPLSYNQEYDETFAGTITNLSVSQDFDVEGTVKIKADGYGTLKLPSGIVNDVLRVIAVYNYTYTMELFPGFNYPAGTYKDTVYTWYDANTRNYIANYSVGYMDNTGLGMQKYQETLQYLSLVNGTPVLSINYINDNFVSIYPNPTNGIINIAGTEATPDVKIYNLTGSLLQQEKSFTIDISNYSTGVYLIDIAGKKYKVMKK
jgi:hypothetical protein